MTFPGTLLHGTVDGAAMASTPSGQIEQLRALLDTFYAPPHAVR